MRGSKPGERRGGRGKGTPPRYVVERQIMADTVAKRILDASADRREQLAVEKGALVAAEAFQRAERMGTPLGKELLQTFMGIFASMAAHYQPRLTKAALEKSGPNKNANEEKFDKYARLAVECAKAVSPYQSPTFRAVVIAPPPEDQPSNGKKRFTLTVVDNHNGRQLSAVASVDDLDGE